MKRILKRTLSLILVLPLLMIGCAQTQPSGTDTTNNTDEPSTESSSTATTEETVNTDLVDPNGDGTLNILFIGNSFSYDVAETFWNIADSLLEQDVYVAILGIGSSSLQMHSRNLHFDIGEYEYKYSDNGSWTSIFKTTPNQYIKARKWDYITIQQVSGQAGMASTFEPHVTNIIKKLHELCPESRILWNMTWAYEPDCTYAPFANYNNDTMTMYNAIIDVVKSDILPREDIFAVIPCATSVQNARTVPGHENLCRDGFHLDWTYGRYVASLTLTGLLIDPTLSTVTWKPAGVTDEQMQYALAAARNAAKNPFEITPLT